MQGSSSFRSLRQTVKRLEEAAISCRGPERAMMMRRWLFAIKEIEKLSEVPLKLKFHAGTRALLFKCSLRSLVLVKCGAALLEGKEVHNAVVSSVQDLASAFSSYQDEVLVKREELLQFVQSAITGLKISTDLLR
ncbi:hypothetical protein V6N13_121874 [Hibiscus sabdariffa]